MYVYDNERVGRWVLEKTKGVWASGNKAIGIEKNGTIKAGVMFNDYTGENGSISSYFRCDDPKVITKLFYQIVFDYPFHVCKVNRITNFINSTNTHSIEITERLGFKKEATLKGYFPDGDGLVYCMWRNECRWLNAKWRQNE
jgi:hypothetical protein